jgi:hypothetical protein
MTVYVIVPPGQEELAEVTKFDCSFIDTTLPVEFVKVDEDPKAQLKTIALLPFVPGDIVCLAGLCPRQTSFQIAKLSIDSKRNYMPGTGIDHRGIDIAPGKMQHRLAIEKNYQTAWPYILVIGDVESAVESFNLIEHLDPSLYWPEYTPSKIEMTHIFGAVSAAGNWQVPKWFKVVDLSVRDLELLPLMYATNEWHDWISFYPANGNFKLENHTQLNPVWTAGSTKPLEYWRRGI